MRACSPGDEGFSYVEILVTVLLLSVALVPALEALQTAVLGTGVHETHAVRHHRLTAKLEEVLAEPFSALEVAEAAAGGGPTSYSDAPGSPERRVVLLSGYDGDNADADDDPFTGTDAGLLWVQVQVEATSHALATLTVQ